MHIPVLVRWALTEKVGINFATPAILFQEAHIRKDNVCYGLIGLIYPYVILNHKDVLEQLSRRFPVAITDHKIGCRPDQHLRFRSHAQLFPERFAFLDIGDMGNCGMGPELYTAYRCAGHFRFVGRPGGMGIKYAGYDDTVRPYFRNPFIIPAWIPSSYGRPT